MNLKKMGFTLLELIMAIGLIAAVTVVEMDDDSLKSEQQSAQRLGQQLYSINNAIRNYTLLHASKVQSNTITDEFTPKLDFNEWLKDSSCINGSSDFPYLQCGFLANGTTEFGGLAAHTIFDIDEPNAIVTAYTIIETPVASIEQIGTGNPLIINGEERGDLSGIAALVVGGFTQLTASGLSVVIQH